MRQTDNIIKELAEIKRELGLLKSAQIFGGDNTAVYNDTDSITDGSGSYASSCTMLFEGKSTGIEISSSFSFNLDSDGWYSNTNEIYMTQISTNKEVAKYENSWIVAFQKASEGLKVFTATGKITTRTPIVVTADYTIQNY